MNPRHPQRKAKALVVLTIAIGLLLVVALIGLLVIGDGWSPNTTGHLTERELAAKKANHQKFKTEVLQTQKQLDELKSLATQWKMDSTIEVDYPGKKDVKFRVPTLNDLRDFEDDFLEFVRFSKLDPERDSLAIHTDEISNNLKLLNAKITTGISQFKDARNAIEEVAAARVKKEESIRARKAQLKSYRNAINTAYQTNDDTIGLDWDQKLKKQIEAIDIVAEIMRDRELPNDLKMEVNEAFDTLLTRPNLFEWLESEFNAATEKASGNRDSAKHFPVFIHLWMAEAHLRAGELDRYEERFNETIKAIKKIDHPELFTSACVETALELTELKDYDVGSAISRVLDLAETSSFLNKKQSLYEIARIAGFARLFKQEERWQRCLKRFQTHSLMRIRNHLNEDYGAVAVARGGSPKMAYDFRSNRRSWVAAEICVAAARKGDEATYRAAKQDAIATAKGDPFVVSRIVLAECIRTEEDQDEFELATSRAKSITNPNKRSFSMNCIAIAYARIGNFEKANQFHTKGIYYEKAAFEIAALGVRDKHFKWTCDWFDWVNELQGEYPRAIALAGIYLGYRQFHK